MKKVLALVALALVMCCCNNNNNQNSSKNEEPVKTEQKAAPEKSPQELYPEKFQGVYIVEKALSFLVDIPDPKTFKSLAIIDGNVAKLKINYLDNDHNLVMKFDEGDWVLAEIDGASPNE